MKTETKTTVTLTRTQLGRALEKTRVPRMEELVLRMRHGLSVSQNETIEMMGGGDPELTGTLAAIERATVAALEERGDGEKRNRNREKILETLKKLR